MTQLLQLPGLGPRRVQVLHEALGIETREQLHRALRDGLVGKLAGFGKRTAERLLHALETQPTGSRRLKLAVAAQYAEPLVAYLRGIGAVKEAAVAGSYRRFRETVGDLDVVVSTQHPAEAIERFIAYPEVREVIVKGSTRVSLMLRSGLQVDLRAIPPECYGAALVYFTGSKAHNIAIRRLAQNQGLKISEYGVFRGTVRIAGATEADVYRAIGLPIIPPELREDRGEITAAQSGTLPQLIEISDVRGDLHTHTKATDGRNTLGEMAEAAKARGYSYLAITDHSRRLAMAHGLDEKALARQIDEIDDFNRKATGITLLKGIEVDILEDGTLDLPESILLRLDIVVAAVHSKFDLSRAAQTERILRALDNPHVAVLSHPTGRLIGSREPYDVDLEQVLREARARGAIMELNAHPDRLDLTDTYCRMARDMGVRISIGTDAHSVGDLDFLRFGIGQARRGWLEARHVVNTLLLDELRQMLPAHGPS
jgi:DNA polymerase (family 10)